nr:rhomboid family intramembrane serine protease [Brochothrix thermosphacta]
MGGSTNTYVLALFGAKINELIVAGEWWRFITPAFIHIGMTHLLMNMVSLFILGTMVEKIFGGWRFLIIYFVSGLTGVIASFVYSDSLSAGASGAIFGLFGALLYLIIKKPQIYWKTLGVNVLLLLGINLVYGFVVSSVDQYAHIGGLIGGLLAAYIVAIKGQYFDWKRWGYTLITLVIIGFFIMLGFRNVNQSTNPDTGNSVVVNYMEHGKTAEAKKVIGVMQKNNYNDNVSDFFAGNLLLKENQTTAAIANYQAAIEKEPQFPEAYYNLALAYQAEGQLKQATSAAKKASEQSNVASYKDLYDKLRTAK